MNKFEKLAQANVDHYNDHPVEHAVLIASSAVAAIAAIHLAARWAAKSNERVSRQSGLYAK